MPLGATCYHIFEDEKSKASDKKTDRTNIIATNKKIVKIHSVDALLL